MIYGAFLLKATAGSWQIVLARAVIMVFVNIALNTFFPHDAFTARLRRRCSRFAR